MGRSPYVLEGHVAWVDLGALRDAGGDLSLLGDLREEASCRVVLLGAAPGTLDGWTASGQAAEVAAIGLPIVAWIDGPCAEEGFEIALACDLRIAAPGATFRMAQVHAGRLPSDGGTQRLLRVAGRSAALWMLLTGGALDAEEARRRGIVQRTGSREDALAACRTIAASAPIAARYAREAVREGADLPLEQGLRLEADLSFLLQSTEDREEGLRSFRERRPPGFDGR